MARGAQLQVGCGEGKSFVLLVVVFPGTWGGTGIFVWFEIPLPAPIQLPTVAAGMFLVLLKKGC